MDSKLNYKRIVIKIGSSSLTHAETGRLNLAKMEHLVRQLSDLHNQGMDVCLVSSGAIAVGRAAMGVKERPSETSVKQACGTGKTDDGLPETVCGIFTDRRADSADKKYNGKSGIPCECKEYI